jgi:hypothetical protein
MNRIAGQSAARFDTFGSRRSWLAVSMQSAASLSLVSLVLLLGWAVGCDAPPKMSSPEVAGLAKRLYTACNTKNPEWLANARQQLDQMVLEGELEPAEQQRFERIFDMAAAGRWEEAEKATFRFMQAQGG